MLIPLRTKNPPERIPYITYTLMLVNTVVFALTSQFFLLIKEEFVEGGGLAYVNMSEGYRFLTSMFLHGDILHLAGNMLFLWIFGCAVEGRLGYLKYGLVYLLSGLAGDALHLMLAGPAAPEIPAIGASGAIMGLLGAALFMFPFAPVTFFYTFLPFRVGTMDWPLWGAGLWYLGWDLFSALIFGSGEGGVANLAHLGGAAGGFALVWLLKAKRDDAYVAEAKAHAYELKDFGVLSRTQLSELLVNQPGNPELLMHLIRNCRKDQLQIDPKHWQEFLKVLPVLVDQGPTDTMVPLLQDLGRHPGAIPARQLQRFADRLEKESMPVQARDLLEMVLKDLNTTPAERESACYKVATLHDQWFRDPQGTLSAYHRFLTEYPMSSFCHHARQRMVAIQKATVR